MSSEPVDNPIDSSATPDFAGERFDWSAPDLPARIGRYRVERLLGRGGFGLVYLARDEQLARPVAIKVPHVRLIARPEDAQAYLLEARTVANLDHPNIVPVHDVGETVEFPCFIVSKFIDGDSLAAKLKHVRPSPQESAELLATIAAALHYAHQQGLVHRDIKPGNILLDKDGKPFVADFGLALRERDVGYGPCFVGTPAYMSPEQARGEGHRVDGRSDIFNLGVVFYELLTGRRPFQGDSGQELMEKIATLDVRPPRQWDGSIPKELERICLKSLAKRAAERYTTAADLADDLRAWLLSADHGYMVPAGGEPSGAEVRGQRSETGAPEGRHLTSGSRPLISDLRALRVVPKGLRSFDVRDADFFLELLGGPRDRDGLPDGIRFWKSWIEIARSNEPVPVGLIYGPSGCGKSSLVKAGLLPRLAPWVAAVYVEASGGETEARLLRSVHRRVSGLERNLGLAEVLAAIRRGQGLAPGDKLLLVIDQFEQWLHAHGAEKDAELVRALRQCDGARVQCLIMVRDDFWLAVSRFMQALEIPLVEGENSRLVDLFDLRHARKVLAALGHAFGALPDPQTGAPDRSRQQDGFLDQAVAALAQEGKVVPVRLSLFAEMFKSKPWTPAALQEIGGAEGVGVAFLDETFSSPTAPPAHRLHQKTAQAVLAALLPEAASDIRGRLRSREELLAACGGKTSPRDFDEVMALLDRELRLVTPADPESLETAGFSGTPGTAADTLPSPDQPSVGARRGAGGEGDMRTGVANVDDLRHDATKAGLADTIACLPNPLPEEEGDKSQPRPAACDPPSAARPKSYQLTHDYLVPSLRTWLTVKQKATRRGRAGLRLAELAALWVAKPERRRLPSLWEFLQVRLLTSSATWNDAQRRMLTSAARFHAWRALAAVAAVVFAALAFHEVYGRSKAAELRRQLFTAQFEKVPTIVDELAGYRRWARPLLYRDEEEAKQPVEDETKRRDFASRRLRASLALLADDDSRLDYLYDCLLDAAPGEIDVLRRALLGHKERLTERLWGVVQSPRSDQPFLCAVSALALYAPDDPRWDAAAGGVAATLARTSPFVAKSWTDALRPVREKLVGPLSELARDPAQNANQRLCATSILAEYAADRADLLTPVLIDGDQEQFAVIFPCLARLGAAPMSILEAELDRPVGDDPTDPQVERAAQGKARAAIALLRLGDSATNRAPEKAWALFQRSPDERVRSYLIHWAKPLGIDLQLVFRRWPLENDAGARSGLLFLMGEFPDSSLREDQRQRLAEELLAIFKQQSDPGLHAAAQWLLQKWKLDCDARTAVEQMAKNQGDGKGVSHRLPERPSGYFAQTVADTLSVPVGRRWYVNSQRQVFVVIDARQPFMMGSPEHEAGRDVGDLERQHRRKIGRCYAIAASPVTVAQLRKVGLRKGNVVLADDCPQTGMTWYEAAGYCNWLSEREGIAPDQWCYAPNEGGKFDEGMRARDNYLSLTGYRLPTEAEREFACRGGTVTRFHFGQTDALLGNYAWYQENGEGRAQPVARLKPNDFGLFDMHGNVWEWCECPSQGYPSADDSGTTGKIRNDMLSALRGGSYDNLPRRLRAANRGLQKPDSRQPQFGFRLARTIRI